jgi:hypothetical protein
MMPLIDFTKIIFGYLWILEFRIRVNTRVADASVQAVHYHCQLH